MRSVIPAVLLIAAVLARPVSGQEITPGVRMIEASTDPEALAFGEAGLLHVEVRAAPGVVLIVGDTLLPATELSGMGPLRLETVPAAADSANVRISYPVIGFRRGIHELPRLQMAVAALPAEGAPAQVLALSELPREEAAELALLEVPLGSATVLDYPPVDEPDSTAVLAPRPAADVVGGQWSIWLLLAVGLATVAGAGGIGALVPRWWAGGGAALLARLRGDSPKQRSLRELERIRSFGWQRDERVDDFYASTTAVLRHFAAQLDAEIGPALTATELVARLERRPDLRKLDRLSETLSTAERVKFGSFRPDAGAAESDWSVIRDWIRDAPER